MKKLFTFILACILMIATSVVLMLGIRGYQVLNDTMHTNPEVGIRQDHESRLRSKIEMVLNRVIGKANYDLTVSVDLQAVEEKIESRELEPKKVSTYTINSRKKPSIQHLGLLSNVQAGRNNFPGFPNIPQDQQFQTHSVVTGEVFAHIVSVAYGFKAKHPQILQSISPIHPYYDDIQATIENMTIPSLTTDDNNQYVFPAEDAMTKEDIVWSLIQYNQMKADDNGDEEPFLDISEDDWAYKEILAAYQYSLLDDEEIEDKAPSLDENGEYFYPKDTMRVNELILMLLKTPKLAKREDLKTLWRVTAQNEKIKNETERVSSVEEEQVYFNETVSTVVKPGFQLSKVKANLVIDQTMLEVSGIELAQLRTMIVNAAALDEARGDQLLIDTLPFASHQYRKAQGLIQNQNQYVRIAMVIGIALVILLVGCAIWKAWARARRSAAKAQEAKERRQEVLDEENSEKVKKEYDKVQNNLVDLAGQNPKTLAHMISKWIEHQNKEVG